MRESMSRGRGFNQKRMVFLLALVFVVGCVLHLSNYQSISTSRIRTSFVSSRKSKSSGKMLFDDKDKDPNSVSLKYLLGQETTPPSKQIELWEGPTLLNISNFRWLINNESICKGSDNVRIMPVLVHTKRNHFEDRLVIRRSWGSVGLYKGWVLRFVFLLGESDPKMNISASERNYEAVRLTKEILDFGDIVLGSFIDTYRNLTYKHLMGYKWILNFCKDSPFVLKVDDDSFVDIMRWLDWRNEDLTRLETEGNGTRIPDVYCQTTVNVAPDRSESSNWYATQEEWPESFYPLYCNGRASAFTVEFMRKIYSVSNEKKFFWIDDVFVTGALIEVAKQKLNFHPEIRDTRPDVSESLNEQTWAMCRNGTLDQKRSFGAVVANVPRGEDFELAMMCLWNKTLHDYQLSKKSL